MAQSRLALLHRSGFGSQNSSNFLSCSLANRTGKRLAGFFSSSSSHRERPVRENSCWRYDSNARGQRCVALRSGTGGGAGQDQASRIRAWQAKRQESFGIRYQNANVLNPWKLGELVKSSGESVQCIVETGLGPGYSFQDVERDLKNCEGSKKAFIKPRYVWFGAWVVEELCRSLWDYWAWYALFGCLFVVTYLTMITTLFVTVFYFRLYIFTFLFVGGFPSEIRISCLIRSV